MDGYTRMDGQMHAGVCRLAEEFTGERVRSRLPGNHARELKVWELVG